MDDEHNEETFHADENGKKQNKATHEEIPSGDDGSRIKSIAESDKEERDKTPKFGKVETVKLSDIWDREDTGFTPWLAGEPLELVGDAIGMEIALKGREVPVGPYWADILCEDTEGTSGTSLVVIENQFGKSNHEHLGKLLTYAGNLETATIVWIFEQFTKEHKTALNWLNKNTDQGISFFGLEIKMLKIGDSLPAPVFNVIASPENWKKSKSDFAKTEKRKLTEPEKFQNQYWDHFQKYAKKAMDENLDLRLQAPHSNIQVVRTDLGMSYYIASRIKAKEISVEFSIEWNQNTSDELNIKNSSEVLNMLKEHRNEIEEIIGEAENEVEWREIPNKKTSKIILHKNANYKDKKDWKSQHEWIMEKIESFYKAFRERVRDLDLNRLSTSKEET